MTVRCCWNICSVTPQTMLRPSGSSASASNHGRVVSCLKVGIDGIAEIVHNRVLIAAGVSAAVGQFSKPFTNAILYGKGFDLRTVLQAGGFPSSHSSAVVATATSLALERGFSDSIFGLAVVYASLVMYDAQGVRREVGKHAKVINKSLYEPQLNPGYEDEEEVEVSLDRLKEVVGHTEVEVIAGALLGFMVALVVNAAST